MEKIEENSRFIDRERSKISFALNDDKMVSAWEANIKAKGTPLYTFYENWSKVNKIQKRKKVSKNDETGVELPMIKRPKLLDGQELKTNKDKDSGPMELFPSDSEDDTANFKMSDEENETKPKEKKLKKKKTNKNKTKASKESVQEDIADKEDVVQDFSVGDW